MDNKSWMKSSIDDLVFENRNQSYGAFSLRRVYDKHMTRGMLIGMLSFLFLICTPILYAEYQKFMAKQGEDLSMKEVTLAEPPPIDPKKIPPPPPPKIDPPPIKDQIRFVPPKVELDKDVQEEEIPPPVEKLAEAEISNKTEKGDENGIDKTLVEPEAPPPPPPVIKEPEEDENKVFQVVQQKPEFPDGEKALLTYLAKNLKYPAIAREIGIEGNVVVRFVVSKTGEIKNAEVLRTIGGGCDAEALRVVNSMPKWSPGKNNGKAVNVTYTLPVRFKLEG